MTPQELESWAKMLEFKASVIRKRPGDDKEATELAARQDERYAAELRRWARIMPLVEAVLEDDSWWHGDGDKGTAQYEYGRDLKESLKALRAAVSEPGEKP